jgi:hypothetical protein
MKILTASAIAVALLAASPALAQNFNTGRPSFDNPRDYDRDIYGNETYYPRNAWFGDRYYDRRPAHVKKKKYKHKKKKIHND